MDKQDGRFIAVFSRGDGAQRAERKPAVRDEGIRFRRILPVIRTIPSGLRSRLLGSNDNLDPEGKKETGEFSRTRLYPYTSSLPPVILAEG